MLVDLHNEIEIRRAISPVNVATGDTPHVSQIIDMANRGALEFAIATGTIADSNVTFAVVVHHGDAANLSDAAEVADAFLLGTEAGAGFRFDDDDEVRKIGYIGDKRYVRLTITPTGNTDAYDLSAIAILAHGRKRPHSAQD